MTINCPNVTLPCHVPNPWQRHCALKADLNSFFLVKLSWDALLVFSGLFACITM